MTKINVNRFRDLIKTARPKGKEATGKVAALLEIKEDIAQARQAGFGYVQLAELIKGSGFSVSADVVKRFCKQVLGEPTAKRKRRGKDASSTRGGEKKKPAVLGAKKDGFRVAGDDL